MDKLLLLAAHGCKVSVNLIEEYATFDIGGVAWERPTAIHSKKNERGWRRTANVSDIHQTKRKGRPMSEATVRANGQRSKIPAWSSPLDARRSAFGGLHQRSGQPRSAFLTSLVGAGDDPS
ncbi:hypothetical protein [Mesorhizobium carmichaelinearum]|uniref:hypothetical protein n=1 Tax=Mesorhizobium carmichaelinearum TaxID=1208188 RepID=UPI001181203F|nr:hypothetical protein [Mesorhizobium carmichaelinearum]